MIFLPISRIAAFLAVFFLWSLFWGYGSASAANFGKYNLSGSLEAELRRESEKTDASTNSYNSFEHRYKLNLSSFVLSPALLNYQLGLAIGKGSTETNNTSSDINNMGYNANANLFSRKPFASSLYASRDTTESFAPLTSSAGSSLVSQTSTQYGANVNLNYKRFPTTIGIDQNSMEGTSGNKRIDRTVRNVRINSTKDFRGFNGTYGYTYTDTADGTEKMNNSALHEGIINLEKNYSATMNLREDLRFSSTAREGFTQEIIGSRVTEKSTNYLLTIADEIVRFNAVTGNLIASLPTTVGNAGRVFTIVKIDASVNTVTIRPFGAETIDGASSLVLQNQWAEVVIVSNGINWNIKTKADQTGSSRDTNINSNTSFSYRPSENFSNDTSLNLFYFTRQDGGGKNIAVNNNSWRRINPEWTANGSLGSSYADSGGDSTSTTENFSGAVSYAKTVADWKVRFTPNLALTFNQESKNESKNTRTINVGTGAARDFPWLRSNLDLGASLGKNRASSGGDTDNWRVSAAWTLFPTERLQLQSTAQYQVEDTSNEAKVVIDNTGATIAQPSSNTAKTMSVDLNYFWNAYQSVDKLVNISGGGTLSSQKSESTGGASGATDRSFFYSQVQFRAALLRNLFFSSSLRGEWDRTVTETSTSTGPGQSPQRTAYILENLLQGRVRKILIEVGQDWREEKNFGIPYSRTSFHLRLTRPF